MRTTKIRLILPLLGATFYLWATVGTASADRRNVLENQPPIRHKVEMRKARFEVTPQFVVSMNQDFKHFVGAGLVLQLHLNDWLGIGISGAFGGGVDTGLTGRLNGLPRDNEGPALDPYPSKQQFQDHLATINGMFSAFLAVTPVAGKVAILGALFLKYDFYAVLGVGGMLLSNTWVKGNPGTADCSNGNASDPNTCDPSNAGLKIGGMFGIGTHLFFNDWIGLNLEIRDFIAATNMGGLDVNGDRKVCSGDPCGPSDETVGNNLFFSLGVVLMLPPTAKISP